MMRCNMRTRIKICGLTTVAQAAHAAALGVDAIGLVFYPPSPRHVELETAADIAAALPAFVTAVGLFMNPDANTVRQTLAAVPLEVLQFHGEESADFCRQFARPYLKSVPMGGSVSNGGVNPAAYAAQYPDARGVLLDSNAVGQAGGSGHTFDWGKIPTDLPQPLILAGGLNPDNVTAAVQQVRPYAVDVSSGVETSGVKHAKGIKDLVRMTAFVNAVRAADQSE